MRHRKCISLPFQGENAISSVLRSSIGVIDVWSRAEDSEELARNYLKYVSRKYFMDSISQILWEEVSADTIELSYYVAYTSSEA